MSEKQALIPRLRFPEFWDAGEWRLKKLGDKDVSSFVKKRVPVNDLDLVSYVSTENILPDFGGIKVASKLPPSGSFTSYKPKDILIANIRPYLKKVWVADRCGAASNDVIVVRPMQGVTDSFLSAHLKSEHFIDHVMKGAKGVKMPRGDIFLIKEYPLAVPDSKEQQKIADCLSSLDELIAAQADKIDALKTHKKGLMQQLFPCEGENTPRLRFPEFRDAGEWNLSTVGDVADVSSGGTPNRSEAEYWNGDIPWVSTSLIDFGGIEFANEYITREGLENSSAKIVPKGTVLMAMYGQGKTRGKVAVLGIDAAINQACAAIAVKDVVLSEFVFQNLAGRYDEIRKISNAGGQENLSGALIKKISFKFPSIDSDEQQKIADCLSSLDALVSAHIEKFDALKTHKKSLMQQLFPAIDRGGL